ncbi:hypothetical protein [Actinoplanes sp. NPDC051411]|uniref:hypothetical protein n=1 Tax=Actinoplanes sp. NPDC051411 TaxID=3155522 RepID=UPI003422CEE3
MKKDRSRHTPRPYGHAAPWNRQSAPAPAPEPAATSLADRWPWVLVAVLIVATVGWLVYDAALG